MTWAIGDIQGCFKPFKELLNKIDFNPKDDTLWLVGDLINRGPIYYLMLRKIYSQVLISPSEHYKLAKNCKQERR